MNAQNWMFRLAGMAALAMGIHGGVGASVPTLAPYPAPGGNSASSSGTPATGGGITWNLGSFDHAAYDKLYYTVGNYVPWPTFDPTGPTLSMDGSPGQLTFDAGASNLGGGIAVWSGTTTVRYNCIYTCTQKSIGTRYTLTVTDTANHPLALVSAASAGLAFAGAMLDVQGDFRANWLFTAQNPNASYQWQPSMTMFDSLPFSDPSRIHSSSVGGAFYATAPVPGPSSLSMTAAGLAMLVWLFRRRPIGSDPGDYAAA